MRPLEILLRFAGALSLAALLSGCVVVPAYGPYYRPHHYYGY